jgi:hypothetical protein
MTSHVSKLEAECAALRQRGMSVRTYFRVKTAGEGRERVETLSYGVEVAPGVTNRVRQLWEVDGNDQAKSIERAAERALDWLRDRQQSKASA